MGSQKDFVLKLYQDITKSDMLHLGYWNENDPVTLEKLPEAQLRYTDYIINEIPKTVKTILDVGCGTGRVAVKLQELGFSVDCVSPDLLLKEKIEKNYKDKLTLYCSKFEDLQIGKTYDLIMMMESCEYLHIDQAFSQCQKYLNPDGKILISDMFRINNSRDYKAFHTLDTFRETIKKYGFRISSCHDITLQILPTLELTAGIYHKYMLPIMRTAVESLAYSIEKRKNYRYIWKIINFLFRKKIKKTENDFFGRIPKLINKEHFFNNVKYLVYLLTS